MTKNNINRKSGWYNESKRHALARRGIKTTNNKTDIKKPDWVEAYKVESQEPYKTWVNDKYGDLSVSIDSREHLEYVGVLPELMNYDDWEWLVCLENQRTGNTQFYKAQNENDAVLVAKELMDDDIALEQFSRGF